VARAGAPSRSGEAIDTISIVADATTRNRSPTRSADPNVAGLVGRPRSAAVLADAQR
jgi:hypothetical protein